MNKIGAFVLAFVLGGLVFGFVSLIGFAVWGVGETVDEVRKTTASFETPDADFSVTSCREVITADNVADLGWDLDAASVNEDYGSCQWTDEENGNRISVMNSTGYGTEDELRANQLKDVLKRCGEPRYGPQVEYQPEWLGQTDDETFTCVQSNIGSDYGSVATAIVYDKKTAVATEITLQTGYEQEFGSEWQAGLADMAAKAREQS